MGVVYKAFDSVTKRFVAVKTLKDDVDPSSIDLFQKEWSLLAQLSHPNIVDVLDIGNFVENGRHRPYFVMPLLPGATLDALMKARGPRLTPERAIEIVCQACRGLQAAHSRGLIHRDLKPSNLFVMDDDTVKIIDFGVVHLADAESRTCLKGTLPYMAPEQLELKRASSRSDIFSLGVVCYEALTGRKPFEGSTTEEIIDAIRSQIPAPISQLNSAVNDQVSRAVHKAMAKQPYHRFSSAREFSEILQRAIRNEHIELLDRGKIHPRMNRIKKALNDGDFQMATDILDELESEGNFDPEISVLRAKTEQADRSRTIYQLVESARKRMEEQEYPLALQNVQRVLDLDPANVDAIAMRREIDRQQSARQIEKWFQIAQQHFDNKLFANSRQAIDEIQKVDPANTQARDLLAAIDRSEHEIGMLHQERQLLYDAALKGYRKGEISSAQSQLEKAIDLGNRAPGPPSTDGQYLALYEQIRSERDALHNSYTEGRRAVESRNFARALDICREVLRRHPGEPLFQALKIEIEDLLESYNADQPGMTASRIPKTEWSRSALEGADFFSSDPDRELAIRCPLPGEVDHARLSSFPSRRATSSEDQSLLSRFSFRAKLVAMVAMLILGGAGLFFSIEQGSHFNSSENIWLPVRLQPSDRVDASQRTTAPVATRNEDMPQTQPPSLPIKAAQFDSGSSPVSFHFGSNPAPARVVVDNNNRLTCLTPCELPLPRGRHTFLMSAPGYDPVQRIMQVPESTTSFASLTEGLKTVRLISAPPGAALSVDGKPKGQTPMTLRLAVGQHKIRITKDDTATERTINVTEDDLVFNVVLNTAAQ
jgi:serine/threonine protein kinase